MFRWTLLFTIVCAPLAASPDLMPYPAKVTPGTGFMAIDSGFRVAVEGFSDARLSGAVRRATDRVFRQTGIVPISSSTQRPALIINCRAAGEPWPVLGEDESYQLDIKEDHALLSAATVTGVMRGMATFVQLIAPGPDGFRAPAIQIEDRPRFPFDPRRELDVAHSRRTFELPLTPEKSNWVDVFVDFKDVEASLLLISIKRKIRRIGQGFDVGTLAGIHIQGRIDDSDSMAGHPIVR